MKPAFLFAAPLAFALAGFLSCHTAFGQRPASPAELKTLVKNYAFRNQPKLNPQTQFAIVEYAIEGLKALDVQIILARYLAPDGSQFNEALLIYHDGKLTPFASAFGGHGLMSAVVSGGKLYYTYSFGSGRHFCRLAQLSIVGGKLTFAEGGPLLYQDFFVKQDGARLRLEKGEFEKFNVWKAGPKIGEIAARESGFAVLDDAGKEIETLAAKTIEEKLGEDLLFPLPPREVAAGKFEQWQREAAKKPSSVTYTRVEYDRKGYWVVESRFGYGDPSEKIAVYAPTKGGSFRRCLLAGPIRVGKLGVTVDAKTGLLNLTEETDRSIKGEVVLSCNLKAIGVLP